MGASQHAVAFRYIRPIITLTRAGVAAGLPLLVVLIGMRVLATYEGSNGDPTAMAWTVAGVAALIVIVSSAIILINLRRLSGARDRREAITMLGGRWIVDVTIDAHSRELLGVEEVEKARTFALVSMPQSVELWATSRRPSASLNRSSIRHVEATPISWSQNVAIALELRDSSEPILLDVVGPLFGTLQGTRAQRASIVEAITS